MILYNMKDRAEAANLKHASYDDIIDTLASYAATMQPHEYAEYGHNKLLSYGLARAAARDRGYCMCDVPNELGLFESMKVAQELAKVGCRMKV